MYPELKFLTVNKPLGFEPQVHPKGLPQKTTP